MQTADNDNIQGTDELASAAPRKPLSPAAKRARAEAEERRRSEKKQEMPPEIGGRGGADPARFGDWEINGRAIDF
ncbi:MULTISPECIES: DUF1674 domain-containing protein [unclassified Sinorhizobium]|uniref:DUF1674 domain-containing protein n=1 Tax=unclassified Sinorhizobium TaxID=2613772 RepID=UPI0035242998